MQRRNVGFFFFFCASCTSQPQNEPENGYDCCPNSRTSAAMTLGNKAPGGGGLSRYSFLQRLGDFSPTASPSPLTDLWAFGSVLEGDINLTSLLRKAVLATP